MKYFSALAVDSQQESGRLFAEDMARQLPELSQLTRVEPKVRGHVLLYRAGDSSNPFYVKELGELYDYYNPDDQLQEQIRVRNRRIRSIPIELVGAKSLMPTMSVPGYK